VRNLFSTPDESIFGGQSNDNVELLKAWAGTTLAYAVVITGSQNLIGNFGGLLVNLGISAVVCGLALVLHELAHRWVARRFGAQAHFVANNQMLVMSLLVALLPIGFFFAAPGAVWHRGRLSERQVGLVAAAGPATNMVFALLFLIAAPFVFVFVSDAAWVQRLFFIGVGLNASIGLFNMIPTPPFDGSKILAWSQLYFGIMVGLGVLLAFVIGSPSSLRTIWGFALGLLGA
jgi:Zn-dependent protease